ncbi:Serine/threonine receptor-like kinase NFP-like protein [Drosera capensis]
MASQILPLLSIFLFFTHLPSSSSSSSLPSIDGYRCSTSTNSTTYPCHTYVYYLAQPPSPLDLAAIGDLFSVSRLMITQPSNINSTFVSAPLVPGQPLFVPTTCGCYPVNDSVSISYANLTYTIKKGDTFYLVSTGLFENLTTYESVEVVNPELVPTNLSVGVDAVFPVFCKCADEGQLRDGMDLIVSYVFQPGDNLSFVAGKLGSSVDWIEVLNGKTSFRDYETVFVPASKLPRLDQPTPSDDVVVSGNVGKGEARKGNVAGMAVALGVCVSLLVAVVGFWGFREVYVRKKGGDVKGRRENMMLKGGGKGFLKDFEMNFLADVSETLDKYRVYEIEELRKATDGFDGKSVIHGSVYKGCVDGEVVAIKKMKWNAYEELKILQKVNHGNLVKLEGFCIDPDDATCYLVYEYIENGSLYSWLHEGKKGSLNWKTRLRIAIDVANSLQYIHEHTRPQVVHKDIKSSNILIDAKMRAKIANFGLAKSGCNAITMHIVGTQGYMAPEYLADGAVSTKLDVFSFGVVLLELISGREAIDDEGNILWMSAERVLKGSEDNKVKNLMDWMDKTLLKDSLPVESMMNAMIQLPLGLSRDEGTLISGQGNFPGSRRLQLGLRITAMLVTLISGQGNCPGSRRLQLGRRITAMLVGIS